MTHAAVLCAALACLPGPATAQFFDSLEQLRDPPDAIGTWVADIVRGNDNPTAEQIERMHLQCAAVLMAYRDDDSSNHGDATKVQLSRYARLAYAALIETRLRAMVDEGLGRAEADANMQALRQEFDALRAAYTAFRGSADMGMSHQVLQDFVVCRFFGGGLETARPDLVEQLDRS